MANKKSKDEKNKLTFQNSLFDSDSFKDIFKAQKSLFDSDSLKDIFKAQKSLFDNDSFKDVFKAQKSLLDSYSFKDVFKTQKSLSDNDSFKDVFKAQKSLLNSDSFKDIFKAQKSLFDSDSLKDIFKTQKSLFDNDSFKDVFKAQQSLFDNETFNSVLSVQKNLFDESFSKNIRTTYKSIFENFKRSDSSRLVDMITNNDFANENLEHFSISGDTIAIENQKFQLAEIRSSISEILDHSGINEFGKDLNDSLGKIFTQLSTIKNSNIRAIIYNTIITIIITALSIIYAPKLKEVSENIFKSQQKITVKKIEKVTKDAPQKLKDILRPCRFVSVKILNVRSKPAQKSLLVGILYFGQVVRIIKKNKNWTFVELFDLESEISIRGWVFTRYIINFK